MVAFCGVRRTPMLLVVLMLLISMIVIPMVVYAQENDTQAKKKFVEPVSKVEVRKDFSHSKEIELDRLKGRSLDHHIVEFDNPKGTRKIN